MAIKLNSEESVFRNELIFAVDAKAINIDNTFINLYMLLRHNGVRPRQRASSGTKAFIDIDRLKSVFGALEKEGSIKGYNDNPEAAELWIRSNLVNMVHRGRVDQEKVSSLRPIHLESYRVRNALNTRDYNSADQVYLMLNADPAVKESLKDFLMEGWDKTTEKISTGLDLDVDSLGLLHLIKNVKPGFIDSPSTFSKIKPILEDQAKVFCEDIKRLLIYKRVIPRNVLIDYLKTLTSFHLSLYVQKLIYLLPNMVTNGSKDVVDDWSIVVDATDDYESKVAPMAVEDCDRLINSIYDYIRATFQINAVLRFTKLDKNDSENIDLALQVIKERPATMETYFTVAWDNAYASLDEDNKSLLDDLMQYEHNYFDRYVELILKARGAYQYKYHMQMLDNLSQKNSDRGLMAQGRSRRHPRRFVIGTRLLEALVQIMVLDVKSDQFTTRTLSIEELIETLRSRYGLIINGLTEERFKDANLNTHLAFKDNVNAFKLKLRQIGFYNDLSDAYILQKIRPRYQVASN